MAMLIIMLPIVEAQSVPGPDTGAPAIDNVQFTHGPQTIVMWNTNEAANSKVDYGNTTELGRIESKDALETAHSITLTTNAGETIYYKITSCDSSGNCKSTTTDRFIAGPFFVRAEIPRYPRTSKIDINGVTRPGATVTVTVNGADVKKDIIDDGVFLFRSVPLQATNTIIVTAELGGETATQTYQADVDSAPPLVNVTIPAVVTSATTTAKVKVSEPISLTVQVGNETAKNYTLQAGSNDVSVSLKEGENMIGFTSVDKAGLKSFTEERVVYDTGPPRFETTNLNKLSPSYRQEIEVKGKLSEPGSVTAFVNGKPQKTEATAADGTFSIKVKLERSLSVGLGTQQASGVTGGAVSIDEGIQWKSKVRLEAVDAAGLKASTDEVEISYAICGSGTWIDVQLSEPMPEILNPRLLIEGIQQVGIAFNYTYRGGAKATIDARNIRIRPLVLSPDIKKEYDNNLVQVRAPNVRAQRSTKPQGVGYIQVNFQPIEDPWSLPEKEDKKETAPANATMFEREERISEHREGDCVVPGMGCMKLFLELEIPFTETTLKQGYDPHVVGTLEKEVVEPLTQRTCIDVNLAIDRRVPPDVLPSGLLKTISKTLGSIVEGIDKILKPIQTIGKYLFYTCVAGQFLSYVPIFLEKYNCEFKKVTNVLAGGEGAFNPDIAAINACDAEYGAGSEEAENCNTCSKWKDYRAKFVRTYRQVCDRVMCPAAPSLQYYLKTKGREKQKLVPTTDAKEGLSAYLQKGELYVGSDCAAWIDKNAKDIGGTETKAGKTVVPARLSFTSQQIQGIYDDWLTHQSDTADEESESGSVNCAGLHPATPECCGYEYMREWSSACGVSALGQGLDTFDEIKESTCLSAQQIGKNEIGGLEGETIQCNKLLNSLSGFCEKNGMPPLTPIRVATMSSGKATELELQKYAESQELYIIVQEKGASSALGGIITTGTSQGYSIKLGIIVKTLEFQKSDKPDVLATSERSKLTEKLDVVEYPGYEDFQERNFNQAAIDTYRKNSAIPASFQSDLASASGSTKFDAKLLYKQVLDAIGTPDKEYIIKPNDGLINSIRCLCFPTIIGYLKMWRNIMGAVKSCVDTILLTGDGETGVCQAVVSRYVCDLLYDVLACFTQKFSTGQSRTEKEGGGDIMGALVAAGSDMSREVQGRYGETGLYKAVFVDRKLVHSICMWAFTGTWNFDLGAVFDQSVDEIPLQSQALLTPCNRRFVAFNPSTRPGGLVTWVYHFGAFIAAGSDIDVELHLVCSDDFTCKESDGYENGRCDCQGKGKRDVVIRPENLPTRTKKNQILNEEIFYTMQAGAGESNVRYDKAYLLYRWKEANKQMREDKTEPCSIGQTGGGGSLPAFCRWDPFTVSFRCSFGEAAGGIRFKEGKPDYKHSALGGVYAFNENLNMSISLQQDYPGGEQYNKYLQYSVIGPGGKELATNKERGLLLLQTNGDYVKRLSSETSPIEVKREWFTATEAGKTFAVRQWSNKNPSAVAENKIVDSVQLVGLAGPVTARKQYVLELSIKDGKQAYSIYTASATPTLGGEKGGFYAATPALCAGTIAGNKITCTPQPVTPRPGQAPTPQDTFTITLKQGAQMPLTDEILQAHVDMNLPKSADPCAGDIKNRMPQQFTMQLMAYDADQYGSPTDQLSIDPYTGAEAVFSISFNAICASEDELKPLEGILGPTEILAGLRTDVNTFKQRQEKYLADIDKWLTTGIKIENSVTIQQQLSTIASTELADAAVLQTKYLKNLEGKTELKNVADAATQLYALLGEVPQMGGVIGIGVTAAFQANNVPARANFVREEIAKTTDAGVIREQLQTFRPVLAGAIAKKDALLALLPAAAGEKGACPNEQIVGGDYYLCSAKDLSQPALGEAISFWTSDLAKTCQTTTPQSCYKLPAASQCPAQEQPATDSAGNYYTCSDELSIFEAPWTKDTGKICYKGLGPVCWKLPAENACTGTDTKGDAYHCEKTCSGNSIPVSSGKLCTGIGDNCCVLKSTDVQKMLALKNQLNQGNSQDDAFYSQLDVQRTPEELLKFLVGDPESPSTPTIIAELRDYIAAKELELRGLTSQINSYEQQGIKVPETTKTFLSFSEPPFYGFEQVISQLNTLQDELISLASQPSTPETPEEVQSKIRWIKAELGMLGFMREMAIYSLDVQLGIIRPEPKKEAIETEIKPMPVTPIETPKTPAPQPTCGNGVIDQGELCDVKDGNVIVPDHPGFEYILYNPETYTVTWGHAGIPTDVVYGYKNLERFCSDLVGEDCNDTIEYSNARGRCLDNCKSFMPRVNCVDDDTFGDDGRAAYLTPKFTIAGGSPRMENFYQYLYSDPNFGDSQEKNMCYPANPEPGTPAVNTNWVN
jgi:hypothetical protein